MADTQQGVRHQSARDAAGTTDTYDGDLRALFNAVATVPAGSTFNEAFMLWLQSVTGSSSDNINDLHALYASQQDDTYNWSSLGSLGPPTEFDWEPETAETPPTTGLLTRASVAQVLTTTDGPFWYQEAKSGEAHIDGLRRQENLLALDSTWGLVGIVTEVDLGDGITQFNNLTNAGGDRAIKTALVGDLFGEILSGYIEIRGTIGGTITVTIKRGSGGTFTSATRQITLSSSFVKYYIGEFTGLVNNSNLTFAIQNAGDTADTVEIRNEGMCFMTGATGSIPSFVNDKTTYNAGVVAVRYFATDDSGNSADGSGVVTEADGATITDGGFVKESAATKRLLDSNDMTQASWTAAGAATPTDLGVTDIGGKTTQVSGLGALGVDDISQSVAGFTASGAVSPSFLLRRVSTTGTLRVVNATGGAANGEWTINLASIGSGWVRLEPGTSVAGFTEVAPWVADGGGNAGVTYHASAGGPLTVDLAFNNQEDGPFATSPMVTASVTVTRAADSLITSGAAVGTAYTYFVDATYPLVLGDDSAPLVSRNASQINRIDIQFGPTRLRDNYFADSIDMAFSGAELPASNERLKHAIAHAEDDCAFALTGAVTKTDTSTTNPITAGGETAIGQSSVASFRGRIHKITIYDARLSTSQLEDLVT